LKSFFAAADQFGWFVGQALAELAQFRDVGDLVQVCHQGWFDTLLLQNGQGTAAFGTTGIVIDGDAHAPKKRPGLPGRVSISSMAAMPEPG
jgi:hypothetical protein